MDDGGGSQTPDLSRPAKRVRLDAPLAVTQDTQQEIIHGVEDDWDDVYSGTAGDITGTVEQELHLTPPAPTCNGPTNIAPSAPHEHQFGVTEEKSEEMNGEQGEHMEIDDGDDLVAPRQEHSGTNDKASANIKEETDEVQYKPQLMLDFLAAATAQKGGQNAEWELDSSPVSSTDSSDSDTSSDSSDDDSDSGSADGYELMDPVTAAKMLMSGDGDDDDGDKQPKKTVEHIPKTLNEQDEAVVKPDIEVNPHDEISLLGTVQTIVDNMITIKGIISGEYQALDSGSVVCNEDYKVIGVVADTFGPVRQPMYVVRFQNRQEIDDANLRDDSEVFYVNKAAKFVFTAPLKTMKGTDASNIHDEEIREDEAEFSDDEKEAEYKRLRKASKKHGRGPFSRVDYEELSRHGGQGKGIFSGKAAQSYEGGGLSYDDQPDEEFYQPLQRPEHLPHLIGPDSLPPRPPQFASHRGGGRGRGRGDWGRGRGGDRGHGRGVFDQRGGGRGGRGANKTQPPGPNDQSNAQSFPDRHNGFGNSGQQFPASLANTSRANPMPNTEPYRQQSYQFNGQTYQYGYSAPTAVAQYDQYAQQQLQQPQQPQLQYQQNPAGHHPAGGYNNPAYYHAPLQPQPHQLHSSYPQSYSQPYAPTNGVPQQPAPPQQVPPADIDIGSILSRLTGPQPQPPTN